MTALQCDAAAIYDKRKDNLRFFLDNLPTHACHVQPNFNLCTVCFKINQDIAKSCQVYQRFNQGIVGSKVNDPLHVDLARSFDMGQPQVEQETPEGLDQEFPLFEFSTPSVHRSILDEEPEEEEEVIDAEVIEAEVVEEAPPKPVVKPVPKAPVLEKKPEPAPVLEKKPAPAPVQAPPVVKTIRKVKMVPKAPVEEKKLAPAPVAPTAPAKPEEKKAPEAVMPTQPAAPPKPVIKKVKMIAKAPAPTTSSIKPMPLTAPKPGPSAGIKALPTGGPGDSPSPGPQPLEPRPDITPPPPGPYPGPSPEPDDDDDYDAEDMALLKDLDKKALMRPPPPPPRVEAKPTMPPGPPKAIPQKGAVPPLFATLGKLETKKKPDE